MFACWSEGEMSCYNFFGLQNLGAFVLDGKVSEATRPQRVLWESMTVSTFGLMSNSALPNWRLSKPSNQPTTQLCDCFRCEKGHNPNR